MLQIHYTDIDPTVNTRPRISCISNRSRTKWKNVSKKRLKIPKRYSEAVVFENFLKDSIFLRQRSMVLCISYQSVMKLSRVRIGFFSLWNYGTSVAWTSDSSNTFWQSLRVRASEVLLYIESEYLDLKQDTKNDQLL